MLHSEIKIKLSALDWQLVAENLNAKGYSLIQDLVSPKECKELINNYDQPGLYRKTVIMERYRFGQGEYKYFNTPLPDLIQVMQENIYPHLALIATTWMKSLNIDITFPETLEQLKTLCYTHNQLKPTVLILKYKKGGYNTLHQDLYGDIYFPMQCVLFLNEPGEDYAGGEFVLLQQTPRAQSKAIVLEPKKGDLLLFPTNFRPVKGTKGFYRVNMKHGVSELHSGERHTLGIIFHDALT